MTDMLELSFMRYALAAGVLLSALAGYFGVFVVQRRMSFLGAGLGHAAFGGIALGLLLDTQPLWVAIPFTVIVAISISWVKDHTRLAGERRPYRLTEAPGSHRRSECAGKNRVQPF